MVQFVDLDAPVMECGIEAIVLNVNEQCYVEMPEISVNVTDNCGYVKNQSIDVNTHITIGEFNIEVSAADTRQKSVSDCVS